MSHVLVVDDEAGFREVLKRILGNAGYEVEVATDAQDALRAIRESAPAVVFTDIHMPGRDGLWLCDQIRAVSPTTAMILCTSDDRIPPLQTLRDGIIAYVIKPFQRQAIVKAVAEAAEWHVSRGGAPVTRTKPVLDDAAAVPELAAPPPSRRRQPWASGVRVSRSGLFALAAVAILALGVWAYWYVTVPKRVIARIARASGVIQVQTATGEPVAQGSGFFVSADTFVTSLHVVRNGVKASVRTPDGATVNVVGVTAFQPGSDLVVLRVGPHTADVLTLEPAPPSLGDEILVYGAPLGLAGTLSAGIVNATPSPDAERLQISAPISPGSSGSPVVNRSGRVVGVASEVRRDGQGLAFAVPAAQLAALLAETGEPRPLIVASRTTGTDVARADLFGDVRRVTVRGATGTQVLTFGLDGKLLDRTHEAAEVPVDRASFAPAPVVPPSAGQRTLDAIGNVVKETRADGSSTEYEYTFDPRGNWVTRQAIAVDAAGTRSPGERVTREIDYYGEP